MKESTKKLIHKIWFAIKSLVFFFMFFLLSFVIKVIEKLSDIRTTDKMYMLIAVTFIAFWLIKWFWGEMEK